MYKIFIVGFAALSCALAQQGQHYDPRTAAILSEQRYLSGDGTFGSAYTQEDGVMFKEESDHEGNRVGSYSYVDPTGQRRTVSYTAGKNGFVASGDHLPQAPPAPAPVAPQPQYQPLPQYNPPQSSYNPQPSYNPQQSYNSQPSYNPQPSYNSAPQFDSGAYNQQSYQAPAQQYQPQYTQTTPAPHRFFPPGKLSLNRSPDGFTYSFSKA